MTLRPSARIARTAILAALALIAAATVSATEPNVWDQLVPQDWDPRGEYQALSDDIYGDQPPEDIADEDPRAQRLFDAMMNAWSNAPLRQDVDGKTFTIPGFAVPLEGDDTHLREFLLVPYYGACIHFPPPPRNQVILVKMTGKGVPTELTWDAIQVEGTLKVSSQDTEYGTAGYVLEGEKVRAYKGEP